MQRQAIVSLAWLQTTLAVWPASQPVDMNLETEFSDLSNHQASSYIILNSSTPV